MIAISARLKSGNCISEVLLLRNGFGRLLVREGNMLGAALGRPQDRETKLVGVIKVWSNV
jgi:hypothetical protein